MEKFVKKNKIGIVLAVLILIIGSVMYFYVSPLKNVASNDIMKKSQNSNAMVSSVEADIFRNMNIKTAYTPEGNVKLFVYARSNDLAKLMVVEGDSIPEKETIVIGFDEAKMMKDEKLFSTPGDLIENLFGVDVVIGGVLNKTGTIIDDMHFVSSENYKKLDGKENVVFIKLNSENMSKVFYSQKIGDEFKFDVSLSEGKIENYKKYELLDKIYSPVIIGSKEAKMMREEKLFEKPGDTIEGFFGQNVIIVGILKETNTSLDMMHVLPFKFEELN